MTSVYRLRLLVLLFVTKTTRLPYIGIARYFAKRIHSIPPYAAASKQVPLQAPVQHLAKVRHRNRKARCRKLQQERPALANL
jgi:hypothetical protein